MGKLIVLEGICGSGKTTLSNKPASNIHSLYLNHPESIPLMQSKYEEALSKRKGFMRIDTSKQYNVTSIIENIVQKNGMSDGNKFA